MRCCSRPMLSLRRSALVNWGIICNIQTAGRAVLLRMANAFLDDLPIRSGYSGYGDSDFLGRPQRMKIGRFRSSCQFYAPYAWRLGGTTCRRWKDPYHVYRSSGGSGGRRLVRGSWLNTTDWSKRDGSLATLPDAVLWLYRWSHAVRHSFRRGIRFRPIRRIRTPMTVC